MKEIEGKTNKLEDILWSWIGRTDMVKMSVLPKPVKILMLFSIDIAKKKS